MVFTFDVAIINNSSYLSVGKQKQLVAQFIVLARSDSANCFFSETARISSTACPLGAIPLTPPFLPILDEMLLDLSVFDSWDVLYIPRDDNFLAHNIARWAAICNLDGSVAISALPASVFIREEEMG
ncbi:hypothetical protein CRG98_040467 [Punica granatum]|uniref:Uncharacterized protein n=1 Tax=Punica granatum TaxID=22663 RepID=A0A2I0I596_PUNGR|nr:hypothetical protein CRG98_040467 [Punica granatum]